MADEERTPWHIEDAAYWGLTHLERARYFGRLSEYYCRQVAYHGERAQRFGRQAIVCGSISLAFLAASALIHIIGLVT